MELLPCQESGMPYPRPDHPSAPGPCGPHTLDPGEDVLFEPVMVGGLRLPNRLVVAPMSRVSTRGDGVATREMGDYYAEFSRGGFGLIVTEGTYIDHAHSQAYANQPALVTQRQQGAWQRVTGRVRGCGARIFLQLMHAGALVQANRHRDEAIAPSAVQPRGRMLTRGYGGSGPFRPPRAMTHDDIAQVIDAFAQAAVRARAAGFDGVEVHAANGYLLDQFLTPYTNLRTDEYGGTVENRVRLTVEVLHAIQRAAGPAFPVGVRVSQGKVNDPDHRWGGVAEAQVLLDRLGRSRPAYVHVSSESLPWEAGTELEPGVTITRLARELTSAPVIANGQLADPLVARRVVHEGAADLVSLGRGAIANPDWPARIAQGRPLRAYDPDLLLPEVTLANSRRWWGRRHTPDRATSLEAPGECQRP